MDKYMSALIMIGGTVMILFMTSAALRVAWFMWTQ